MPRTLLRSTRLTPERSAEITLARWLFVANSLPDATGYSGERECEQWRPLVVKVVCECGKRFAEHSRAVQDDALVAAAEKAVATHMPINGETH